MNAKRAALAATLLVLAGALAWTLFAAVPRWAARRAPRPTAATTPPPSLAPGRKIKARLFYVNEDGVRLVSSEHDVAYGEGTLEQAKEIINAQLAPAVEPLVSAVPPGTTLRAIFVTPQGEAYVDLSGEVSRAHPGGTVNEILTVYTIVDALTVNLPAVSSVQILVDGKEADTLAGHVDLHRPFTRNLDVVE